MSPKSVFSLLITALALVLFLSPATASAQTTAVASGNLPAAEIERIIKTFTAREGQFRRALNAYSFKRDAVLQSLGMGGQITGEYHRVSLFTFDDAGTRYEKISY